MNPKPFLGACMPVFETGRRPRSTTLRCRNLAEGAGIEPAQPLRADYGLASRCIAALPTFRTTRKIDLMSGAAGVESNPQPPAYKAGALPIELQRRESFGFVFVSWRSDYTRLRAVQKTS